MTEEGLGGIQMQMHELLFLRLLPLLRLLLVPLCSSFRRRGVSTGSVSV